MSENALIVLAAILFYPLAVLMVAITGPHNETERRELRQRGKRRKP